MPSPEVELLPGSQRFALGVAYDGSSFQGWQSQPSGNTVQDRLEAALGELAAQPIRTSCAGRTDAGVHALMQVVHFDTTAQRREHAWVRGTNALLPRTISVEWALEVPREFHSRVQALARRYVYVVLSSPVRPSLDHGRVGWVMQPLDQKAMQAAAAELIGEHDFSSFRAAECQALSPVKDLRRIDIHRRGAYWRFEFEANAFLHHMVRNIMGSLVAVGTGRQPVEWMREVLAARSRAAAAPTFAPDGLYFMGPRYDARWGLPDRTALFESLP